MAIASIGLQFYELLLKHSEISDPEFLDHIDKRKWPKLSEKLADIFKTKSRYEIDELK